MRTKLPRTLAATLVAAAVAVPALAHGSAHTARVATVTLKHIAFTPKTTRIKSGSTVKFVWRDGSIAHNVTSTGRHRFHGSGLRSKGSISVVFHTRGTYSYECTIHPGMTGKIIVS